VAFSGQGDSGKAMLLLPLSFLEEPLQPAGGFSVLESRKIPSSF